MTSTMRSTEDHARQPCTILSRSAVVRALDTVDDPEYPGVSIVDLGLVEQVTVREDGSVRIGLIPTFSGCPALAMIRTDVAEAVAEVPGVRSVIVEWLSSPVWTMDRISPSTRRRLAEEFTVAVRVRGAEPTCPRCGGPLREQSLFGPSRCRSVSRCDACSETIEVMRS